MIGRRQLAVASPISAAAVARAIVRSAAGGEELAGRARAAVEEQFRPAAVALTDSGTSALILALRLVARPGAIVGFPAFACIDLAAAAQFAGVRVRLYDIDPETLSPDLGSLDRMLARGVEAVVVAHLYGFPADVPAVVERAASVGIPVIEDAAQAAGATLHGRRLGLFGNLGVLSFGRGKGLCAGGGGALLGNDAALVDRVAALNLPGSGSGAPNLGKTIAQWVLGRPSVYAIPSMIPGLRLGEMVYRPAHEPRAMSRGSCALVPSAFTLESEDVRGRRGRANVLRQRVRNNAESRGISALPGAQPSFLRFPVVDTSGERRPHPAFGILRSYPATAAEQEEMRPLLVAGEPPMPGAIELRRALFTLPTHRFVTDRDMAALASWLTMQSTGADVANVQLPR